MVASGVSEEHEKTGALGKLRLTGGIGMVLGTCISLIPHTMQTVAKSI